MKIEFYEEFPDKENLKKLKQLKFSTKLFICAKSISEFKKYEKIAKKYKKDLEVAYWPVVKNSYWISLFSNNQDLRDLFNKLEKIKNPLLIDLELPLNKKMILKNLFSFFKNRRLIKNFLQKHKNRITTAQPVESMFSRYIRFRGQNFDIKTEKSLMWYSSMLSSKDNSKVKKYLPYLKDKENYSVSLGTIAVGILGDEPILSPKDFEKDLKFVKKCGFEKIVVFRLKGLNKEYLKILNKFI